MVLCSFGSPYPWQPPALHPSFVGECCRLPLLLVIHEEHHLWHLPNISIEQQTFRPKHTSKCLALLQSDAGSQAVPVLPHQLCKLEHNLLSSHYAGGPPCWECLLRTLHSSLELRICALRYPCDEIVCGGVVELDEMGSFGLYKFVVNEVWRILDILDLLVRSRIVVGSERRCCSWLEVLSCGMQSSSRDLGILGG